VFTAQLGSWWPKDYSIGDADMADFVLETRVGGRWYEVGVGGKECDTGRVTGFDPPHRLTLAWHLNDAWQYDPEPAHASEVEIRFVPDGPTRTTVELEHRGFERHGDASDAVRGAVDDSTSWTYCLDLFAKQSVA
jgi:uncharacterized protein YndB with AHSA1/START domain